MDDGWKCSDRRKKKRGGGGVAHGLTKVVAEIGEEGGRVEEEREGGG